MENGRKGLVVVILFLVAFLMGTEVGEGARDVAMPKDGEAIYHPERWPWGGWGARGWGDRGGAGRVFGWPWGGWVDWNRLQSAGETKGKSYEERAQVVTVDDRTVASD